MEPLAQKCKHTNNSRTFKARGILGALPHPAPNWGTSWQLCSDVGSIWLQVVHVSVWKFKGDWSAMEAYVRYNYGGELRKISKHLPWFDAIQSAAHKFAYK